MYIKVWGSRGSIAVSGKEYIKYGGDTTCLEMRTNNGELIIIDAGTGIRRLGKKLLSEHAHEYHFIFTHAHWDHLMGFPFFKPIYMNHSVFRMHRCPFPRKYISNMLSRVMAPPNFPVRYTDLKAEIIYEESCNNQIRIGNMDIIPIPLSHPNTGSGYKFIENGKSFVFLTDNELDFVHPGGLPYEEYVRFVRGVDLLFHDGEYTPEEYRKYREYGHTSYIRTLELAMEAGVKYLGLFHLNQDRPDWQMDEIVEDCRRIIQARNSRLKCFAVGCNMAFHL